MSATTIEEDAKATQSRGTSPGRFNIAMLMIITSTLTSLLTVFLYDQWYAPKIVSYDIKGFVAQQRDDLLAGKITPQEFKNNLEKVRHSLDTLPPRTAAIASDVVLKNIEIINPIQERK